MKQFTVLLDDDLYDFIEQWGHENDRSFSESCRHGLRMFFLPVTAPEKAPRGRIPFKRPELDEIGQYILEKGFNVDAEEFYAFYESKGWRVGNQPMRSWQAACLTWHKRHSGERTVPRHPPMYTGIVPRPEGTPEEKDRLRRELEEFEAGLPPEQRRLTKP